ncbi:MAG: BspA family leucine-rich repeat surface protein [Bacteroidaceae bacterium]|nr:BspA family leucine-rich repeat surface protein [Bacteroidaceae bacterium]
MKKIVAWLLVLALTAAVSIGATLAYLSDTDEDVNVMTIGKVKIDQLEYERVDTETKDAAAEVQKFHDNKPLFPAVTDENQFNWETNEGTVDWTQIGKDGYTSGIWNPDEINNELDKMVFVKNKGDYDAYVRSVFAFEANGYTVEQFKELFHLNINETDWTWDWVMTPVAIPNAEGTATTNYIVATATYNKVLKPGEITEISLSQIALDSSATNEDIEGFGDTYQILVMSQGIQSDGFEDAGMALDEGFGSVSSTSIPWETDSATKGIDLRTALHYLNGDKTKQITKQVTNVYFDLNSAYPALAEEDGTLVDVEQDNEVYAHYVPNGTGYDIYFLADGPIYSPANSAELFIGMSSMVKVDTENFDVSRVTDMYKMFRDCTSLTTIDVSNWDTSKVTRMGHMFRACLALEWIDVSNWDTGKVEVFNSMFSDSSSNTGRMKINNLDFSNWDMSSATNISYMFYGCGQMTDLDLSGWDVSKVTTMNHTFCDCFNMKNYNFTGWNTASLEMLNGAFNGNDKLVTIDLSDFDTQNVYDFGQLFDGCYSLENIIGLNNWDTSKAIYFYEFLTNTKVREIDLSSFSASQVQYTRRMFFANSELTTIYVSDKWNLDISTLDTTSPDASYSGMTDMFFNNPKLEGGNGSKPADFSSNAGVGAFYGRVDTPETPGLLTHIDDKPVTNP